MTLITTRRQLLAAGHAAATATSVPVGALAQMPTDRVFAAGLVLSAVAR